MINPSYPMAGPIAYRLASSQLIPILSPTVCLSGFFPADRKSPESSVETPQRKQTSESPSPRFEGRGFSLPFTTHLIARLASITCSAISAHLAPGASAGSLQQHRTRLSTSPLPHRTKLRVHRPLYLCRCSDSSSATISIDSGIVLSRSEICATSLSCSCGGS